GPIGRGFVVLAFVPRRATKMPSAADSPAKHGWAEQVPFRCRKSRICEAIAGAASSGASVTRKTHETASGHMTTRPSQSTASRLDRRHFLSRIAAGLLAGVASARQAFAADDNTLQALIDQNQRSDLGQNLDSASRTIPMPKTSLPMLSPLTVQTTASALTQYENIVARGGWPKVPPTERLRLGNRHPSVIPLRKRLSIAGDLDATAGETDVFDSYVEAAVRRFQIRHGVTVDGVVRQATFNSLNVPADVRLAQLKVNLGRLRTLS